MPYEWPPDPILDPEEAAERMAEALTQAWLDLEDERLMVANSLTMIRKREVDRYLREFQAAIAGYRAEVVEHVTRFLELHIGPVYEQAVTQVAPPPEGATIWTQAHIEALTALAIDTFGDFLRRSQEAGRTAEAFARAVRQVARGELFKAAAGDRTPATAAKRIEERLVADYGITHVTYRDGSRVDVGVYARMAARTKSAVAQSSGTLNRSSEAGVAYVEVFDGTECGWSGHGDPDKAKGSIRTVVEAAAQPISHPNCTRAFGPRPDVRTPEEAAAARPSTSAEQDADQATYADYFTDQRNAATRVTPYGTGRTAQARRARRIEQRNARLTGGTDPEQVGSIIARLIAENGLGEDT